MPAASSRNSGDGVLGIFGDAAGAVSAMADHAAPCTWSRLDRWPHPLRMDIRVGVASGEVVDVDGDCYGDAVNVASRLCERAGPVRDLGHRNGGTAGRRCGLDVWYRKLGMMEIRGKAETLMLYQVEWRQDEEPDSLTMQSALISSFSHRSIPSWGRSSSLGMGWICTFSSADAPVHGGPSHRACPAAHQ